MTELVEDPSNYGSKEPVERHARKCTANRTNGTPCERWAIAGGTVCPAHGGRAPQVKRKARQRIDEAADRMAKRLLGIALDDDVPPAVALAAVNSALDRAGLRPPDKVDVEVGVKPYERLAGKVVGIATSTRSESRAARGFSEPKEIGAGDTEIVDAEIVEDHEPTQTGPGRPAGMRTDDGAENPPGKGLMPYEDALAAAHRSNLRAGVYDKRNRRR